MSPQYSVMINIPAWSLFQDQIQAIVYMTQVLRDTIAHDKTIQIHIRDLDIIIQLVPEPPK